MAKSTQISWENRDSFLSECHIARTSILEKFPAPYNLVPMERFGFNSNIPLSYKQYSMVPKG